jgi:hypothetical protein
MAMETRRGEHNILGDALKKRNTPNPTLNVDIVTYILVFYDFDVG